MQPRSRLRLAALAVWLLWFVNGLVTASIAARLPDIAARLDLKLGEVGMALVGQSLGLVVVVAFFTVPLMHRYGARAVAVVAGLLYGLSPILPAFADGLGWLFLAFLAVGALNAPVDIAQSELGGLTERAGGATMSIFETGFVGGQVAGAGLGLALGATVTTNTHLGLVALISVALILASSAALPRTEALGRTGGRPSAQSKAATGSTPLERARTAIGRWLSGLVFSRQVAWLAAVALGALWCEGAIIDWVTILYRNEFRAPGRDTVGLACFAGGTLIALLMGGWLRRRLGDVKVAHLGALLFASGMLSMVLSHSLPLTSLSLLIAGFGLANVHPMALSTASAVGGPGALAVVQGASFVGLVAAKPVVGALAEASTLRLALGIATGALTIVIAIGSRWLLEPGGEGGNARG